MLSVINADRTRNGQPVKKEISVSLQDGPGLPLPRLFLFSDWSARKGDWRTRDVYDVEEIIAGAGMDGRAFLLHRTPEAIAKDAERGDADAPERYGVFVARNDQDHICECRGFQAHGRCKHLDAVRGLIADGHLDAIGAAAPVQPFPTPEQVTHDSLIEAPF